jgi:hypothetical protein
LKLEQEGFVGVKVSSLLLSSSATAAVAAAWIISE